MNIFFLEYKDKNFFCCLQTFFITGLTFSDRRKILSKTLLGCFGRKPDFFPDPVFLLLGYVEEYKKKLQGCNGIDYWVVTPGIYLTTSGRRLNWKTTQ